MIIINLEGNFKSNDVTLSFSITQKTSLIARFLFSITVNISERLGEPLSHNLEYLYTSYINGKQIFLSSLLNSNLSEFKLNASDNPLITEYKTTVSTV